jgi:hypothetical protein
VERNAVEAGVVAWTLKRVERDVLLAEVFASAAVAAGQAWVEPVEQVWADSPGCIWVAVRAWVLSGAEPEVGVAFAVRALSPVGVRWDEAAVAELDLPAESQAARGELLVSAVVQGARVEFAGVWVGSVAAPDDSAGAAGCRAGLGASG